MLVEPYRFRIEPDSDLARFLEEAGESPVLLEKNGKVYRLVVEPDHELWADYDPEKVRAAIRKTAGSWKDIDADKFIADLYRAREEGSRPANRP